MNKPIKNYKYCWDCRTERETARYNARPRRACDGAILYSEAFDEYFDDLETAEEWLDEETETLADLRLVICEPVFLRQIEEDHWAHELGGDGELPEAVKAALKALNLAIREAGPVSWEPGKFAVDLHAENPS